MSNLGTLIVVFASMIVGAYLLGYGPAYILKRFKEFTQWTP